MRSTRCIRRSRFRIRDLRISSAPAPRRSSRTMPARICSCSAHRRRRTGARSISSRRNRSSRCAGKQYIGHGKNVLGDPRIALAWLANELRQLGVTLRAGEVVTTGTCHPPLPIQSGDVFEADFGVLGKVSVAFELGRELASLAARKSPSRRAHGWRRTGSRSRNRRSCPSTDSSARCARRSSRSARNAAPAHR